VFARAAQLIDWSVWLIWYTGPNIVGANAESDHNPGPFANIRDADAAPA